MRQDYDIIIATDLRLPGGNSSSTVEEIKAQYIAGYRTGLLHIPNTLMKRSRQFNEKIMECVRLGYADLIPHGAKFKSKLLILRHPRCLYSFEYEVSDYEIEHCLIVANHVAYDDNGEYYNITELDVKARKKFRSYEWAPIGPLVREPIDAYRGQLPIKADDWVNIIDVDQWSKVRSKPVSNQPVIGRASRDQYMKWPAESEALLAAYPDDGTVKVNILGGATSAKKVLGYIPTSWSVLPFAPFATKSFLHNIDFFVYFHHPGLTEAFGRAILEALSSGAVVILPKHFEPLFKDSCIYAEAHEVQDIVKDLYADWPRYKKRSDKGLRFARKYFSYEAHAYRLEEIIGRPTTGGKELADETLSSKPKPDRKVVLFMSSNGVGVGHLTRLMSMAKRSSSNIQPVFFTLSQAVGIVEGSGFLTEHMPSAGYIGIPSGGDWSSMLRQRLEDINMLYGPSVIVFDGTYPYEGLLKFLSDHTEIKSVWSRRAMWKKVKSYNVDNLAEISKKFTQVIEPGDISESIDDGATVAERKNAYHVNPVTLLDKDDLLGKKEARKLLGLSQDKTIGLVQLGAGNINDTSSILNSVLSVYKNIPNLEICVTKSVIANKHGDLKYSNVTGISHYPLSECLNAFDFAVGAAGYNSFHEFLNFGVPTLIIPNTHAKLDNALNRVSYPESKGALLVAMEDDVEDIKDKAKKLLDPEVRNSLRTEAQKLYRPNGAADAMKKIESLVGGIES